jgi:hypothetical protein
MTFKMIQVRNLGDFALERGERHSHTERGESLSESEIRETERRETERDEAWLRGRRSVEDKPFAQKPNVIKRLVSIKPS